MCVALSLALLAFVFFFNDTATTEIYTLSLHDALPISEDSQGREVLAATRYVLLAGLGEPGAERGAEIARIRRSEEHTSELQSQSNLVCRLLLEKKKNLSAQVARATYHSRPLGLRPPPA